MTARITILFACLLAGCGSFPEPVPQAERPKDKYDVDEENWGLTEAEFKKLQQELRDEIQKRKDIEERLDRQPAGQVVDLTPLEKKLDAMQEHQAQIATKKDLMEAAKAKLEQEAAAAQQQAAPATSQTAVKGAAKGGAAPEQQAPAAAKGGAPVTRLAGWTGCRIHTDGHEGRCPPCDDLKSDIAVYEARIDSEWTFGLTTVNHFQLVYHDAQDMIFPTFEFYDGGTLVHTIEGYPRTYETKGYRGPLAKIFAAHPVADKSEAKRAYRARQGQSIERLGGSSGCVSAYGIGAGIVSNGTGYGDPSRARVLRWNSDGSPVMDVDNGATGEDVMAAWNAAYQDFEITRAVQRHAARNEAYYYSGYGVPSYTAGAAYYAPVYRQTVTARYRCIGGVCYPY